MSDDDCHGAKIITFPPNSVEAVEKHEGKSATRESDRNPSGIINALLIAAGNRPARQDFFLFDSR